MGKKHGIIRFPLYLLFGAGFCILLGYFFYGSRIFDSHLAVFQFVVYGVVGSVFYASLGRLVMRNSWILLGAMLVMALAIAKVSTPLRIVPFLIAFAVLGLTLMFYRGVVVERLRKIRVGKFIILSIVLGISLTLAHWIYGLIVRPPGFGDVLRTMSKAWLLMGAGLGLGFELTELLMPRFEENKN